MMRFIRADKIYTLGTLGTLENAVLIVDNNGTIKDILESATEIDPLKIESFKGAICPGFVNAHCHLELSHLKGRLAEKTGIVAFAKNIIKNRSNFNRDFILDCIKAADEELYKNGVVAVGDISNDESSFTVKSKSPIYYHTFIELIGHNPKFAETVFNNGLQIQKQLFQLNLISSLAPHAPYSVSIHLMDLIKNYNEQNLMPNTIHNQESQAEDDFIRNKTGDFLDLYSFLNASLEYFEATKRSSLQHTIDHLSTKGKLQLVHNTYTNADDVLLANNKQKELFWCLCPSANLYIENKLPPISLFEKNNCSITIGTDSYASNHQLCVLSELKQFAAAFPQFSIEELLNWACLNGAKFLGIDKMYGSIEKGKQPGLNNLFNLEENKLTLFSKVKKIL